MFEFFLISERSLFLALPRPLEGVGIFLTNHFWCIFEPHLFRIYFFSSKQEACQEVLCEQEVNEIMSGCHPSLLKTVSQQVVSRIRTSTPFDFWLPTPIAYRIIQIHTKFGWLKWLHIKKNSIWGVFSGKGETTQLTTYSSNSSIVPCNAFRETINKIGKINIKCFMADNSLISFWNFKINEQNIYRWHYYIPIILNVFT